jgi:hypothetical protein
MTSRSITGLVLAALLTVPAAARAADSKSSSSGFTLGVLGGAEWGDASGYQLRVDGEVPITRLSPTVQVAGVLSLSYAGLEHSLGVFEIVPAARLNWKGSGQFGAYGDLGLGFAHASAHGSSASGATMRLGAGGVYEMNPKVKFLLEFAVHPHWGDYDQTTTTLLLGAKFAL